MAERERRNLTLEEQNKACELAVRGDGHEDVCNALRISLFEFWEYRKRTPDFAKRYVEARREGAHALVDGLRTLAMIEPDQAKVTNQSRNVMWIAAKLDAPVFGEKVQVEQHVKIDLLGVIDTARRRADALVAARGATRLLPGNDADAIDALYEPVREPATPDLESDAEPAEHEGDVYR